MFLNWFSSPALSELLRIASTKSSTSSRSAFSSATCFSSSGLSFGLEKSAKISLISSKIPRNSWMKVSVCPVKTLAWIPSALFSGAEGRSAGRPFRVLPLAYTSRLSSRLKRVSNLSPACLYGPLSFAPDCSIFSCASLERETFTAGSYALPVVALALEMVEAAGWLSRDAGSIARSAMLEITMIILIWNAGRQNRFLRRS